MLVMPDLKDVVKEKQIIIDSQKYQIDMLQKDLYKMIIKLKEINASVEKK